MTVEELKFNNYPTLSNLPTNSLTRVSLTKEIKISKGSAQIYRTNCYHFHFNQQLKQIYADEIDVSCTDFNKALVSHPVISRTLDESILNFNTLDEHDFSLQNVVLTLFLGAIFLLSFCIFLGRILYDSYLLSH